MMGWTVKGGEVAPCGSSLTMEVSVLRGMAWWQIGGKQLADALCFLTVKER